MPYLHLLPDPGMNYTLNRSLLDGTSPARLQEISAVAQQIKDYESWHTVWLGLAKRAEAEKRWLDAASYYHGAEFYLPAGDVRNGLYERFRPQLGARHARCRQIRAHRGSVPRRTSAGIPPGGEGKGAQHVHLSRRLRFLRRGVLRPEVLDWCEANGLDYILGLAPTSTLKRHVGGLEASTSARFKADPTAGKIRRAKRPPTPTSSCRQVVGQRHLDLGASFDLTRTMVACQFASSRLFRADSEDVAPPTFPHAHGFASSCRSRR